MLSGRPLLYLSIPGVAFILGVFWFRRRNKNRLTNEDLNPGDVGEKVTEANGHVVVEHEHANGLDKLSKQNKITNASKSMNIKGSSNGNEQQEEEEEEDSNVLKMFGKSAPIKIVQNCRTSPGQKQQPQIDAEELTTKIQDAENKVLRSIDEDLENLSSSVDLPDSVNRVSFYSRRIVNQKHDEPVVIKATTTPKISPENSFLECKYTTSACEQNNNCNEVEKKKIDTIKEHDMLTAAEPKDSAAADAQNNTEKRIADVASPVLSLCSEQSGDSGKGSSLPRSEAALAKTSYEFFYPNSLVGQLYGRHRGFINYIKSKTSVDITLRKNRNFSKVHVCVVEGTEKQINAALMMIRERLPIKRYPNFTMQRIHFALPQTVVPLSTESLVNLQLQLIEGINNDVVVCSVMSGNHIFVQHPLHPSHPSLAVLQKHLYDSYTATDTPLLPSIELNAVCVLSVNGIWYRVQIVQQDAEDSLRCIVKFLDFGGYMNVHFNELRQIRSDFMAVPFQATECVLSNVEPAGAEWTPEAADTLCKLTKGIVLQAQVAGYNTHNVPEIYLFACLGPNNIIFINKEMVGRNLAKWVEVRD